MNYYHIIHCCDALIFVIVFTRFIFTWLFFQTISNNSFFAICFSHLILLHDCFFLIDSFLFTWPRTGFTYFNLRFFFFFTMNLFSRDNFSVNDNDSVFPHLTHFSHDHFFIIHLVPSSTFYMIHLFSCDYSPFIYFEGIFFKINLFPSDFL